MKSTVLIVDDDLDVRESLREFLEGEGYPVFIAGDGRQALELLGGNGPRPCLVVLDVQMPEMDGPTFLGAVPKLRDPEQIRVVVNSGSADFDAGPFGSMVVGQLRKPFDLDAFLVLVERYCG